MAKTVNDLVLDAALQYLEDNGLRLCFCSQEPATYTEAITTYKLADLNITSTDFTGPANGDVSGRKTTLNAQTSILIDTTGTSNHLAIVDTINLTLLYVTTHTAQALTSGNTLDMAAWDIEIEDPA